MDDVLPVMGVLLVGAIAFIVAARSFARWETRFFAISFIGHVAAGLAQVWITLGVYGGGDINLYHRTGVELAELMRLDFEEYAPEVLSVVFQREPRLPFGLVGGATNPTGSMHGLAAFMMLVLNDSLYATCVAIGVAAFFSQLALYRTARDNVAPEHHRAVLLACMLMPSVVFWTSALLKEAIAMCGFGWVVYGWFRFVHGRRISGLLIALVAAVPVALVKAYTLFAFVAAGAVWWYWDRSLRVMGKSKVEVRPALLIVGAAAAVGLVLLLGKIFPRYSLDAIAEETGRMQDVGTHFVGGSSYTLGEGQEAPRTLGGQLAFAPLALLTALFRPLIFEVTNAPMLVNALETTVLAFLMIRAFWGRRWRQAKDMVLSSPFLMFCVVFTLSFGVAVSLATTNLGTLSRYRVPMMPLYAMVLLVINPAFRRAKQSSPAPQALPPPVRRR